MFLMRTTSETEQSSGTPVEDSETEPSSSGSQLACVVGVPSPTTTIGRGFWKSEKSARFWVRARGGCLARLARASKNSV